MPRRLRVNLEDIMAAFENGSAEMQYFLDLEDGDVVPISGETRRKLDAMYDDLVQYEEDGPWAIQRALEDEERGLTEQEQAGILALFLMEGGYGARYALMPHVGSDAALRQMSEFVATVQDTETARVLNMALNDRSPHRRFFEVLNEFPGERDRWAQFRDERSRGRVLSWLSGQGIEPVPTPG